MNGRRKKKPHEGQGWRLIRSCPRCGRPEAECRCSKPSTSAAGPATVRVRLEKRRGKPVTVLTASNLGAEQLKSMVKELKTYCATGGTIKGDQAELQGDHRERVSEFLERLGIRPN